MAEKHPEPGEILVAIESFSKSYAGSDHHFTAGQTRVRSGHPILRGVEHLFKPVEAHYEVEAATAAPGERRGA